MSGRGAAAAGAGIVILVVLPAAGGSRPPATPPPTTTGPRTRAAPALSTPGCPGACLPIGVPAGTTPSAPSGRRETRGGGGLEAAAWRPPRRWMVWRPPPTGVGGVPWSPPVGGGIGGAGWDPASWAAAPRGGGASPPPATRGRRPPRPARGLANHSTTAAAPTAGGGGWGLGGLGSAIHPTPNAGGAGWQLVPRADAKSGACAPRIEVVRAPPPTHATVGRGVGRRDCPFPRSHPARAPTRQARPASQQAPLLA